MITPAVRINGYRVPAQYGENVIPVHAGPNRIDVSCQWLKKFGEATLETTVPESGQVMAYYAAPMHQFSRGAIGYEKQKRPGMVGFAVVIAVIVVIVMLVIVLAARSEPTTTAARRSAITRSDHREVARPRNSVQGCVPPSAHSPPSGHRRPRHGGPGHPARRPSVGGHLAEHPWP